MLIEEFSRLFEEHCLIEDDQTVAQEENASADIRPCHCYGVFGEAVCSAFFGIEEHWLIEDDQPVAQEDSMSSVSLLRSLRRSSVFGFFGIEEHCLIEDDQPVAQEDSMSSVSLLRSLRRSSVFGFFGN